MAQPVRDSATRGATNRRTHNSCTPEEQITLGEGRIVPSAIAIHVNLRRASLIVCSKLHTFENTLIASVGVDYASIKLITRPPGGRSRSIGKQNPVWNTLLEIGADPA